VEEELRRREGGTTRRRKEREGPVRRKAYGRPERKRGFLPKQTPWECINPDLESVELRDLPR